MKSDLDLQLADDVARFYADPLGFVMWAYPWGQPGVLEKHEGPDTWQREFLIELGKQVSLRKFDGMNPVAPIRMVVVSGHGVGKSVLCAWVAHWIMSTRPRARGTATANTFSQLSTKTWAAVQSWAKLLINKHWFVVTGDSMYFAGQKESWALSAQSCKEENSESFAGQHAADSTSFYLFDESSGIPEKIWEVAEGGLTDGSPIFIACGNPTKNTGKFQRITFGNERDRWTRFSVDSRNSKFTNKQQIKEWIEQYGEDSDFVRIRVRGECPRAGSSQLIPSDAVESCRRFKSAHHHELPKILAVDVARFGDDRTVIGLRQGRRFEIFRKFSGLDTVQTAEQVIAYIEKEKPDAIVVDGDGLGAGVVDQLRHRGIGDELHEFHGGARPFDIHKYFNRRAEIWGLMGDWLVAGAQIPDDPELAADLTGPQYGYSNKSQIQLERKEDMKARGMASPDCADTLAMTFSVTVLARMVQPEMPYQVRPWAWGS
ncbi:MAG: hypothetical protein WA485_11435 [Candidatus Sulfotelmatobacter sp.]